MRSGRSSLPAFAAAALAVGGLLGAIAGDVTISGMRADVVVGDSLEGAYGMPLDKDPLVSADTADLAPTAWDRGYHWARARALRHPSACAIDSAAFQNGCEAAVRHAALDAEDG